MCCSFAVFYCQISSTHCLLSCIYQLDYFPVHVFSCIFSKIRVHCFAVSIARLGPLEAQRTWKNFHLQTIPFSPKGRNTLSSQVNQSTSIIHQETPDITGHLSNHSSIYNKQPHCKHVYTMTEELIYTVFNQMKRWTLQTWRL